ncbi:unnamed protein product [Protopolystoma xenopodis]|uniref:Uncharacterized protein n=1 Tax=Protopolystoma xenopodis TaxID=117903 RepID=A0A3S5BGQ1_9PLAT|nr:unnamed protein product [Protopolystoma xenopodis]
MHDTGRYLVRAINWEYSIGPVAKLCPDSWEYLSLKRHPHARSCGLVSLPKRGLIDGVYCRATREGTLNVPFYQLWGPRRVITASGLLLLTKAECQLYITAHAV